MRLRDPHAGPITLLIEACWHANPEKRPQFTEIVETLTDILKKLPRRKGPSDVARWRRQQVGRQADAASSRRACTRRPVPGGRVICAAVSLPTRHFHERQQQHQHASAAAAAVEIHITSCSDKSRRQASNTAAEAHHSASGYVGSCSETVRDVSCAAIASTMPNAEACALMCK